MVFQGVGMASTYKIGEAAALLNLKTYVLRFWETEFPDIAPLRTEKGQRLYTREHLALLEHIRYLLHERGLTISGARKILVEEKAQGMEYHFDGPEALPGVTLEAAASGTGSDESIQRDTAENLCRQCNLPGIETHAPELRPDEEVSGSQLAGTVNAVSGNTNVPATPDQLEDEQVLPLVAVAKAAFQAGRISGRLSGQTHVSSPKADNTENRAFLPGEAVAVPQTDADSLSEELSQARKVRDGALLSLSEYRNRTRGSMRGIVEELEAIADILRE